MKRFLFRTTILFLALAIAGYILYSQLLPQFYLSVLPIALIFFYFITNLVHFYLLRIAGKDMPKFTAKFMAASFIKMFVYIIFGVAFAVMDKETAKIFLANFLFMYICFSTLEVYEILKVVKQQN